MNLLYVRPYDNKEKSYLVKPGLLAAFLQGHNLLNVGIIVHEVPGYLVEHLTYCWENDRYFCLLEKPKPPTNTEPEIIDLGKG